MDLYGLIVPLCLLAAAPGPGFLLVRRLGLDLEETLTASLAISLLLLALETFLLFACGAPPPVHLGLLLMNGGLTLFAVRELGSLVPAARARRLLGGYALLASGCLACLGLIRGYSGGMWYGDWWEHYQRSLFFLGGHPSDETFLGYALPARPPLVNLIGAHLLAVAGDRFRVYQLGCGLLSLSVFFPAWLLYRLFARRIDRGVVGSPVLLGAFLLLNPLVMQNVTYCWTKLPAVFFILTGLYFHLTGLGAGGRERRLIAGASLSAAILTHYSAIPYAICLAAHGVIARWRRGPRALAGQDDGGSIGELAAQVLIGLLVLGSWLGWSAGHYGLGTTIASTSTVRDATGLSWSEKLLKIVVNARDTIVPPVLRGRPVGLAEAFGSWGRLREAAFNLYQMNLPFAPGILAPLLLAVTLRRARGPLSTADAPAGGRKQADRQSLAAGSPRFWTWFVALNLMAGIATHGTPAPLGLAHVSLQPLILLAIILIAARFATWGPALRSLAVAGVLVDATFGILLHLWFESIPFGAVLDPAASWWPGRLDLGIGAGPDNWSLQQRQSTVFLGADLRGGAWLIRILAGAALALAIWTLSRPATPRRAAGIMEE